MDECTREAQARWIQEGRDACVAGKLPVTDNPYNERNEVAARYWWTSGWEIEWLLYFKEDSNDV